MKKAFTILLVLISPLLFRGCRKIPVNPNYPNAIVDFTIYPNSIREQELNYVSGFKYYTSDPQSTSRGIIVYRLSMDEFKAYDRLPPNYPNACTDSEGNTTRLVVELPYAVDHCNNAYYNILNGDLIVNENYGMLPTFPIDSVVVYPLIQYRTLYDGYQLRVYN